MKVTNEVKRASRNFKFKAGDVGTVLEPPDDDAQNCLVLFDGVDAQRVALKFLTPIDDVEEIIEEVGVVERNLVFSTSQEEEIVEQSVSVERNLSFGTSQKIEIVEEVVAGDMNQSEVIEEAAVEGNLSYGAPQQGVELQYGLPQQTLTSGYGVGGVQQEDFQYNVGSIQQDGLQYNGYVAGQGGVELQYSEPGVELQSRLPQQTMTSGYDTAYVAGQVGVELQYGAPQPIEEVVAVERNLAFGTPQQGVELNHRLLQQTIAPEYGVGSVQQKSMQYNQYVTGQVPQYGAGSGQQKSMQYSGYVAGQGVVELQYGAPQQTTNYAYGVPSTVAPQQGVPQQTMMPVQQKSMQHNGSVAGQGRVALQYGASLQTTKYEYGAGSGSQNGMQYSVGQRGMQHSGSVTGQGGVGLQYGAPQQTTKPLAVAPQKEPQQGVKLQYSIPQQTTKYEYGAPTVQPIGHPAQGGRIVSENRSLPTETVLAEVPTLVSETAPVAEVVPVTSCSLLYSTAPQKNVTITGPPWMIRASVAPPPVLAVKVQPQH